MAHKVWKLPIAGPLRPAKIVDMEMYIKGYILGMEDAVNDLDDSGVFRDESYSWLRESYMESIQEARETLKNVREMGSG